MAYYLQVRRGLWSPLTPCSKGGAAGGDAAAPVGETTALLAPEPAEDGAATWSSGIKHALVAMLAFPTLLAY